MNKERDVLIEAVHEAGAAILALQETGFAISRKANNDLLTQADLLANDMLKTRLLQAFPDYGWLSEESADDVSRLAAKRVWVVDPIDGTKEYALGIPEYAISVALVEEGEPVLACVFNPATDEFFHAIKGEGAWLNGHPIICDTSASRRMTLLASRSECKRGEWDPFLLHHEVKQIGSIAYKLALIAAGQAHATFSLGPKNEWDIAAGVLLVKEAHGLVTDQFQQPFLFNQEKVLVNGIVATSRQANSPVFEMISGVM
jgi:myo-inositol-1(or 4)-monophosphatase